MANARYINVNPMHDLVVFEVEDMDNHHVQLVVAKDVVEAASKVTQEHGPKLRGYSRIAVIDMDGSLEHVAFQASMADLRARL